MQSTPFLRRIALGAAPILAAAALAAAPAAPAASSAAPIHLHLERSEPMADSTVATAPTAIRLWFSQTTELGVTSVRLKDAADRTVTLGALTRARGEGAPVVAPVRGAMAPGRYTVAWRTMARDGHPVSGTFAFTLAPGPSTPQQ